MTQTQYAAIPFELIEKKVRKKIIFPSFHLYKIFPYHLLKFNNIIVQLGDEEKPYIEEVITKNKIGLNKKDNYLTYVPGNIMYKFCTKEEAYLMISKQKSYYKKVNKLFSKN